MSDNSVTIESLQSDNAQLRSELDSLKARIQAKDDQDRDDKVAAAAKKTSIQKSSNTLNQRPTSSYIAPTPAEEALARKYFGPQSNARLANRLAFDNPAEYKRIRQLAINVGGLVG